MQSMNYSENSSLGDVPTLASTEPIKPSYYQNFRAIIYLNLTLLLLQSFTSSGKVLLYNVFKEGGYTFLAPTQYICNYFFGPLALLLVDKLIGRFRFNFLFYLSSFCQNLFLLGGLLVTFCQGSTDASICIIVTVSVTSSILAGILQTLYYVSFTSYINSVSNDSNKSFYYGLSYSINSGSSLLANFLGLGLSSFMSDFQFYLFIVASSLLIQLLLYFVVDVRKVEQQQQRSVLQEIRFQFVSIKVELVNYKFRKLIIFLCFAGMMNSVLYLYQPEMTANSLVDGFQNEQYKQYTFIIFAISGLGQILGGASSGKLCERFSRIYVTYSMLSLVFVANSFSMIGFLETNFKYACIAAFFFGFSDSSVCSLGLTIITKEISQTNHVFAAFNLCQSMGFGFPSIFWLFFNPKIFYWDLGFVYWTAIIAVLSLIYYDYQCNNKKSFQSGDELKTHLVPNEKNYKNQ